MYSWIAAIRSNANEFVIYEYYRMYMVVFSLRYVLVVRMYRSYRTFWTSSSFSLNSPLVDIEMRVTE